MYSTAKCSGLIRCLAAAVVFAFAVPAAAVPVGSPAPKVDFSYAFATPHRITVGRPDASDRTLLDLQPGSLRMAWTYENLTMPNYPPLTLQDAAHRLEHQTSRRRSTGKPFARSRWTRLDGVLPALGERLRRRAGSLRLEVIGGNDRGASASRWPTATSKPHQFVLRCDSAIWGENPAWVDPDAERRRQPGGRLERACRPRVDPRRRRRRLLAAAGWRRARPEKAWCSCGT